MKHEDVEGRLEGVPIYWVGRYVDSVTRVMFGCEECGHEWLAMPAAVLGRVSGCPSCFSRLKRGRNAWINRGEEKLNSLIRDHGDWLDVDVSTPMHQNKTMKIDRIDYDAIVESGSGRMHVGAYGYVRSGKKLVHRLILSVAKEVDHINQDKLDNRRCNLREVEAWQNQANRGPRKNNKLGVTGVSWRSGRKSYRAQHEFKGKLVLQSYHETLEEAKKAREESVRKYCGAYAPKI